MTVNWVSYAVANHLVLYNKKFTYFILKMKKLNSKIIIIFKNKI